MWSDAAFWDSQQLGQYRLSRLRQYLIHMRAEENSHGMTKGELAAWVRESRKAQGKAPKVRDASTIARVLAVLDAHPENVEAAA